MSIQDDPQYVKGCRARVKAAVHNYRNYRTDDTVEVVNVRHIIQSDFNCKKGKDRCLEFFGEEDDECREYNKQFGL